MILNFRCSRRRSQFKILSTLIDCDFRAVSAEISVDVFALLSVVGGSVYGLVLLTLAGVHSKMTRIPIK